MGSCGWHRDTCFVGLGDGDRMRFGSAAFAVAAAAVVTDDDVVGGV